MRPDKSPSGIAKLRLALAAVRRGEHPRDKLAIAYVLVLYPLFPLARFLRKLGLHLPGPGWLVREYRCGSEGFIYRCPGDGPYFLFCDPRHDPGVRDIVNRLNEGIFVDVGSHVGFFSLPAARKLAGRGGVVAIEPHPIRFEFLRDNVCRNRLDNVICLPYALSDRDGQGIIYDLDRTLGEHTRDVSFAPTQGRPISVNLRKLDTVCQELGLDTVSVVKIDVEGFEANVIAGMSQTIARWSPQVVFEALTPQAVESCRRVLASFGYAIRPVDSTNYLAERLAT